MKKVDTTPDAELRPEYRRGDLGKGVRGRYYEAYIIGTKEVSFVDECVTTRSESTCKGDHMEQKEVVQWVIDRTVEILAEAEECRKAGDEVTGKRLADIAGGLLYAMYDGFGLEEEFMEDLEGIRGSFEATNSWILSREISRLHGAFREWVHRQESSAKEAV
jgi:hypothetical protein